MRLLLSWPVRAIVAIVGAAVGCALAQHAAMTGPAPASALTLSPRISFLAPHSSGVVIQPRSSRNQNHVTHSV